MPKPVSIEKFLLEAKELPIIDVRSPGEFAQGHIPTAINIPLFDDEERAKVGITYKHEGKPEAVDQGMQLVGPKLEWYIDEASTYSADKKVRVHCWRGGMRSAKFAEHLEKNGFEVCLLEGGYKEYRRHVRASLETKGQIIVLGGMTGSGKTEILKELKSLGEQVIDLEGLAHHKGSAFGHLGQEPQPTTEHFENLLGWEWLELDENRLIWLEDESLRIGHVSIPKTFYDRMRSTTVIQADIPLEERAIRLDREYGVFDHEVLTEAINRITKRLGGQHAQAALEALDQKDYREVARITLNYYDKAYLFGLAKRNEASVFTVELPKDNPLENAKTILKFTKSNKDQLWKHKLSDLPNIATEPAADAK